REPMQFIREWLAHEDKNLKRQSDWGTAELFDYALGLRVVRGMQSTSDFPTLLEAVLNQVVLASYVNTPDRWRSFCGIKSVKDFRSAPFYRTAPFGVLDPVSEGGEYHNKSIPDGTKVDVTLGKAGNIYPVTREALLADSTGALQQTLQGMGRAAALTIERAVF